MSPVFGLSEVRAKAHLQPFICRAAYFGNNLGGADDNSLDAQEPDEVKISSPVLKQRRGQ